MPTRRRIALVKDRTVDPLRAFLESVEGLGLEGWWPEFVGFKSEAQSRGAWPRARRAVWAETPRGRVPAAATRYDGVTLTSLDALLWAWNHITFDVNGTLKALRRRPRTPAGIRAHGRREGHRRFRGDPARGFE